MHYGLIPSFLTIHDGINKIREFSVRGSCGALNDRYNKSAKNANFGPHLKNIK